MTASDEIHPAALEAASLTNACSVTFTRRSGPGGQNRNKVETAVILSHKPTGVTAEASERRTQGQNLKAAVFRLRMNLALQVRRPARPPSGLWRARCPNGRITLNPSHDDAPALIAEALDTFHAQACDVKAAAEALGCTTSQLLKLLKSEPRAFKQVNDERSRQGLHPLA